MLPPPEPGSVGYTALQDQLGAAVAEVIEHADRLIETADALLVASTGPWAEALLTSVAPILGRPGRRVVCAHIQHNRGPQPLYVVTPQMLICELCLDVYTRRPAAALDPHCCHRCGRHSDRPLRLVLARRDQVLARGWLCSPCLSSEHYLRTTNAPQENQR